ncbi:Threonine/homoserine/homoserine lactone efflux protein [Jannaschia faecimaris]|uniref:Threonine/homoserine/homoserine lactone efflux protein n=2 Tax=Jannaschia faecimaris TaxID=1244108 RepID=A0A1H3U3B6_9RHOB|nr:Threonine/homoserine/homoserine lactone efflux protein [Jannaschia faecimaris]
MLYILSRSVGQSRSAGLASALGLAFGGIALAVATALGLAAAFSAFDWLVPVWRIFGSLYLVWLGVGLIQEAGAESHTLIRAGHVRHRSFFSIIWQGIWVELLNPKTVLFFALFLPPFIDSGANGSVQTQLLILGILVPLTAIPCDLVVAWLGGTLSKFVNHQQKLRETLAWLGGLTLIAIAANLHLGFI